MFVNNSNTTLTWNLNLETASPYIEDGIFQLLHRSGSAYILPYNGDYLEFPPITLGSGEMLNLGVLFTPGILFAYIIQTSHTSYTTYKLHTLHTPYNTLN